jgi:hypothetical protein
MKGMHLSWKNARTAYQISDHVGGHPEISSLALHQRCVGRFNRMNIVNIPRIKLNIAPKSQEKSVVSGWAQVRTTTCKVKEKHMPGRSNDSQVAINFPGASS